MEEKKKTKTKRNGKTEKRDFSIVDFVSTFSHKYIKHSSIHIQTNMGNKRERKNARMRAPVRRNGVVSPRSACSSQLHTVNNTKELLNKTGWSCFMYAS